VGRPAAKGLHAAQTPALSHVQTVTTEPEPHSYDPVPARLSAALGPGYEVRQRVGGGGYAEVYEVWELEQGRRLAVKVLRPELAWTPEALARFREEGRILGRLNHPNILPIHFVAEHDQLIFIAMPFVEGQSLRELIATVGSLSVGRALEIARPMIQALGHAHQNGLVHRDIKPDNIMLERWTHRVLLVDFGVAKQMTGGGIHSAEGWPIGSPHYMSPEQALTGRVDARSDIYSVGATLYEMLAGMPPFVGNTFQEIMAKHAVDAPPDPRERNRRIPGWLASIVSRCLAKLPADRPQSAEELLQEIENAWDAAPETETRETRAPSGATASARIERASAPVAKVPGELTVRLRWSHVALASLAILALVSWSVLGRSGGTVMVHNRLVEPIKVRAPDGAEIMIRPGQERAISGPEKGMTLRWSLVRPVSDSGIPMGVALSGEFGAGPRASASWFGEQLSMAPVVINGSTRPISIVINPEGGQLWSCHCLIPPGSGPTRIGYYPLLFSSTLVATDPDGRHASVRITSDQLDDGGATVIRIASEDFR
jgi:serine/threonine protein kinase